MKLLCIVMVFLGAFILGASIWHYFRVLKNMKEQIYDKKTFDNKIYNISFAMMLFFFFGYIGMGIRMITSFQTSQLLIGLIFFCGACFVFCMVKVQQLMLSTIIDKTMETMQSLVDAIEAKDPYTKGHSEHVCMLVELIYHQLPSEISRTINLKKLKDAAILHDIGKIGIPDGILNKPGKLTAEEMTVIRLHPQYGSSILEKTSYRELSGWIKYHHERMDGQGYYCLPGDKIPIESRIIATADTFSALCTDRIYRKRYSYEDAVLILRECAGTQLDQQLVEVFCAVSPEEVQKDLCLL